jgi:predicted DsbA family dithiol-disulfide isomerase
MRVEIWSDIACPFCYLGKARFERALADFPERESVEVVFRSFELDPGRDRDDVASVQSMLVGKYGISPEQAAANEHGIGEQAAELGLGYRTEGRDHGSTFDMHRLLQHAAAQGAQGEQGPERQAALLDAFFRGNFADEETVYNDDERLVALATGAGLAENGVRAVLADPGAYAEAVRADEREAAQLGATGVPFFVLDRRVGVSGAQPVEVFGQALRQAWDR